MPGRHDPEVLLASIPPHLTADRVPAPHGVNAWLSKFAADWCAAHPAAVWAGTDRILEMTDLASGGPV